MTSIAGIVGRIKENPNHILDKHTVEEIAKQLKIKWRDRTLDPATTLRLFLLQVLHGNVACSALPHIAQLEFTASAYCQARSRLPLELFTRLCGRMAHGLSQTTADVCASTFFGHRVFLIDGSASSMPDTPELQNFFGQPSAMKPGCGFPVAHLLCLFDAVSGMLHELIVAKYKTHDMW